MRRSIFKRTNFDLEIFLKISIALDISSMQSLYFFSWSKTYDLQIMDLTLY